MFSIMYSISTTSILYTGSLKSFPNLCGNSLKYILLYLYCINYNEINIYHSGVQKHVSHTGSHRRLVIYYGLQLKAPGNVYSDKDTFRS